MLKDDTVLPVRDFAHLHTHDAGTRHHEQEWWGICAIHIHAYDYTILHVARTDAESWCLKSPEYADNVD